MPNIDRNTLLVAVQAVSQSITRYEALLQSETLSDLENIEEILISYDEALKTLKGLYKSELESGANLPALEKILYTDNEEQS